MPGNTKIKKYTQTLLLFVSLALLVSMLGGSLSRPAEQKYKPSSASPASFIKCSDGSALSLSSEASALIECDTGEFIYKKNADKRMPMASTTKIMTALIVIEKGGLDSEIRIPKEAVGIEGSSVYLREGEVFTVKELLYALMLASANDAATVLAIHTAGSVSAFASLMNEKAAELGLSNTHFENPHGLPASGHYTTASELAVIAREASKNQVFREITSTKKTIIRRSSKESARLLVNHNKLLSRYEGCFGVKTGFTKESGRCLVSGAERDGLSLIAVTLNAPNDWNDHEILLDFGFSKYKKQTVVSPYQVEYNIPVCGSYQSSLTASNREGFAVILPKDSVPKIEKRIEGRRFLFAPVSPGECVAYAVLTVNGNTVARIPLYTERHAAKKNK